MNLQCKEQLDLLSNPKFHDATRLLLKQWGMIGLQTMLELQQARLPSQKELARQQEEDEGRKFAMKEASKQAGLTARGDTTEKVRVAFENRGGKNYHGIQSQIARELGMCQVGVRYHLKKLDLL